MRLPLALYSLSISFGPASAADRNVSVKERKCGVNKLLKLSIETEGSETQDFLNMEFAFK